MSGPKRMTLDEFLDTATGNGSVPIEQALFECPGCKLHQSAQDLMDAGAGEDLDAVEKYLAFSCVGRWDESKGCDWTLGGLLTIHEVEVETGPDQYRPCFKPVPPPETVTGGAT